MNLRDQYLEEKREEGFSDLAIKNIITMCDELHNKFSSDFGYVTGSGLLVGEVQSGKTSNFIALALDVFEKDTFDIVVILGGTISNLKEQTEDRLSGFVARSNLRPIITIDKEIKSQINIFRANLNSENSEKQIISCLKQKDQLATLKELLTNCDKRVLIIDDESDQATPNVHKSAKNYEDLETEEQSRINKSIVDLLQTAHRSFLLLVTATPYANLIAPSFAETSPSWGYVLTSDEAYYGLDEFHFEHDDHRVNRIKEFPVLKINNKVETLKHRLNKSSLDEKVWFRNILNESLLSFVVGNAVTRRVSDKCSEMNFEMLIHSHSVKEDHHEVEQYVLQEFKRLQSIFQNDNDEMEIQLSINKIEISFDSFMEQLSDETKNLAKSLKNEIIEDCINVFKVSWNSSIYIYVNNGDQEMSTTNYKSLSYGKDVIIIGADKIQRGITFEKLRYVFMPRLAQLPMADTILQRARWFGYRSKFAEFMTIALTRRLIWLFNEYITLRNEINSFLESNFHKNKSLRNINKFISVPKNSDGKIGRLTRKSVNPLEGNETQISKVIQKNPISNSENEESQIKNLLNHLEKGEYRTTYKEFSIVDAPSNLINTIFKKLNITLSKENFHKLCKENEIDTILFTVFWHDMENNVIEHRKRSISCDDENMQDVIQNVSDYTISALQQGRNQKYSEDDVNFYPGDENIWKLNTNKTSSLIEFQIHKIKPFFKQDPLIEIEDVYMYAFSIKGKKEFAFIETKGVDI